MKQPLEGVNAARSRKEPRIPVVLSKKEVAQVLTLIDGTVGLMVRLLYASGLRISESVRLRVQDVDFDLQTKNLIGNMFFRAGILPLIHAQRPKGAIMWINR